MPYARGRKLATFPQNGVRGQGRPSRQIGVGDPGMRWRFGGSQRDSEWMREGGAVWDASDTAQLRTAIASQGPTILTIDELTEADLPDIEWAGGPSHLRSVSKALSRVPAGEVEYLVVRAPNGRPIAKGGVDYTAKTDVGLIWQVATREEFRSLGIGGLLIGELERRMQRRGLEVAMLSVDQANPRPQRLYERLGYGTDGERLSRWEVTMLDGSSGWYDAVLTDLRKVLRST